MYSVQKHCGNQWVIVDQHALTMCTGTMRQCEDWLDSHENLLTTHQASSRREAAAVEHALALSIIAR